MSLFTRPVIHAADDFGPEEWHQYRMNSDKNAVFDNGRPPLENQTYQTADQIRATPVIAGNKLFVGNHNTGDLFAFNVLTGEKLWQNQAPNWIHSEMIYNDGQVYVGFGNRFFQGNGIRGTGENGVIALDAETGEKLWTFTTEGEVMPTPAYYEDALYIATGDKHLYKLDPETGELLHKAEIGSTVSMSSPNITDETLYMGGSGPLPYTFYAYDVKKDVFKWQMEFPDVFAGLDDVPPAVANNTVVTTAVTGDIDSPEHWLYALNAETGEILWEESLGTGAFVRNNKSGAPIIYDDKVLVGSPITQTFYAYDLESGEKLWEFENEVIKAPPAAQDGIVYFSNKEGMVYALDTETGEVIGKKELNGILAPSGPVIINDTLFIGSQDSNVYAVPLTDFTKDESAQKTNIASENDEQANTMLYIAGGIAIILLVVFIIYLRKRVS
ncbi:PQQ-binding-like beta-propeller repeat protein [Lentibacillus persicus]|uniref:outer membrane protein assembly factor BamB family protein n=1 Tax=Lentibacillus persicus TaxID=640948 RepID=UPI001FE10DAE|nr:PQQ-binding-like beta-propeller repeat protein [Lentibacillus persicus]